MLDLVDFPIIQLKQLSLHSKSAESDRDLFIFLI